MNELEPLRGHAPYLAILFAIVIMALAFSVALLALLVRV